MKLMKKLINIFKKDDNNTSNPFKVSLNNIEEIDNFNYEIPEELKDNPAFNRTMEEIELKSNFLLKYERKVKHYEYTLHKSNPKINKVNNVDLRIKQYELSIKTLNDFKEFCSSKGLGGKLYFEDIWEHCHNSKNSDFKFVDKLYQELNDLKNNINFYIKENKEIEEINEFKKIVDSELIDIISKNQGILQKDIYIKFKPYFKDAIQSSLYFMDKNKKIVRKKSGSTYELYTK